MKFLISHIIQQSLDDPRLGIVTVLAVKPTEDLKEAKIYVSVLGTKGDESKARHALEDAKGFIQREVGKNLETRNTPVLHFVFEEESDQSKMARIESLIREANEADREAVPGEESPEATGHEDMSRENTAPERGESGNRHDEADPAGDRHARDESSPPASGLENGGLDARAALVLAPSGAATAVLDAPPSTEWLASAFSADEEEFEDDLDTDDDDFEDDDEDFDDEEEEDDDDFDDFDEDDDIDGDFADDEDFDFEGDEEDEDLDGDEDDDLDEDDDFDEDLGEEEEEEEEEEEN